MKHVKSERLKKLETELQDLEQWLKLGLVPKKDVEKHKEEIRGVRQKIEEEKERLQFLRESGDAEEYITPKRNTNVRTGYTEMPTIPDLDGPEGIHESGFDMESEAAESDSTGYEDDGDEEEIVEEADEEERETKEETAEEEDDTYFSERNRWRRGGILDPDATEW